MNFRYIILAVAFVNALITYFFEKIVIWYLTVWHNRVEDMQKEKEFAEEVQRSL